MKNKQVAVWKEYFDADSIEYDMDYYTMNGQTASKKEKFKTSRYPYMVVNDMTTKVLAEQPKVVYQGKEVDFLQEEDYRSAVAGVLGYGEVVIIPSMYEDILEYQMMPSCDTEFVEVNGELKQLTYLKEISRYDALRKQWVDAVVTVEHKLIDNLYVIMEDNKEINSFRSNYMAPYLVKCQSLMGSGQPIYATATGVINDLNIGDLEKHFDRELSQKMVLLPQTILKESRSEKNQKRNANATGFINDSTRRFRLIPTVETAKQEPIIVDGGYDPTPYHLDKNQGLHMLSMHCGFGSNYYSEDGDGGVKSATEIVSSKSTLYQSKKNHDKSLKRIIELLFRAYLIFTKSDIAKYNTLEITFSDSIITDDTAKQKQLLEEVQSGIITETYYLKQVYGMSEQDIADAIGGEDLERKIERKVVEEENAQSV